MSAENFGCKVLWRSTECVCGIRVLHVKLAQTEITQSDVTGVVEEDILGLEVTEDSRGKHAYRTATVRTAYR